MVRSLVHNQRRANFEIREIEGRLKGDFVRRIAVEGQSFLFVKADKKRTQ